VRHFIYQSGKTGDVLQQRSLTILKSSLKTTDASGQGQTIMEPKMKPLLSSLALLLVLCATSLAFAGSDDAKWVAKCISDNKDAKVSIEVITKYCTCMNNKMDDNETLSITAWEKTHPAEQAACDKESGWTK
jgi:hypothetical protein